MSETVDKCTCRARPGDPRFLVIGCGNPMAGDDSAGVEIVRRLQAQNGCACQFRLLPDSGIQLLQFFDQADVILFVDAVVSDAPAGTLHLVSLPWPGLEPRALAALSSHGWGLTETLVLTRVLGRRLPRLMLLGVEIQDVSLASPRSTEVEEAIGFIVREFPRLRSWLMDAPAENRALPQRFSPRGKLLPGESQCA